MFKSVCTFFLDGMFLKGFNTYIKFIKVGLSVLPPESTRSQ